MYVNVYQMFPYLRRTLDAVLSDPASAFREYRQGVGLWCIMIGILMGLLSSIYEDTVFLFSRRSI